MKFTSIIFISLLFFLAAEFLPQSISGRIVDDETNLPLAAANVQLTASSKFTTTDADGNFSFQNFLPNDQLKISFIGFESFVGGVNDFVAKEKIVISMKRAVIPSQSVLVASFRKNYERGASAYSEIGRKKIEEDGIINDVPDYLSSLPSATFYAEGGGAIGYSYLSVRGFDQRRISISVNGIPQNDPEDHNVYWVDMSDLLANAELIQVQRGSGAGINGYPAIGGAINIVTSNFSDKSKINFSSSFGSFNARKFNLSVSSGLIDNKYSIYAKLGKIKSAGYRDLSWVDFNSYFLSVIRFDEKMTTQFNAYGGPISDGLVYTGLPKFAVKDKSLRRKNFSYWEEKNGALSFSTNRKADEIENFSQPHYEILTEYIISEDITFNNALFLVLGEGFFDYDGSWSVFYDDYFRLRANGFDTNFIPQNAIIRAMVENKQWGIIPRANVKHADGELTLGAELRFHSSLHWGSIKYAENIPPDVSSSYRYYQYEGEKNIFNFFLNEKYKFASNLTAIGEVQTAFHQYKIKNEKYAANNFSISNWFINPRVILSYEIAPQQYLSLSAARVTREPRLKNYYDAAESSAGEAPQFKINARGNYNFDEPLVSPEAMNNFELGYSFANERVSLSLNGYYMIFDDEIVSKGQVDRFGQPVTGNMKRTLHRGIEFSFVAKPANSLETIFNFTLSENKISDGETFFNYFNSTTSSDTVIMVNLNGNKIAGFPNLLSNLILNFRSENFFSQLKFKYVGEFYSDNYGEDFASMQKLFPGFVSYPDNRNDAYFTADIFMSYTFHLFESMNPNKIFFQASNLFNSFYSAHAIGGEFFPAAERNFSAGVEVSL